MSNELFLLLVLAALQVVRVAALRVSISPDHVMLNIKTQTVTFTCTADTALVGCQFRWKDYWEKPGPLLDLSRGPESWADPDHLERGINGYSYAGRGLGAGDCGVSLQVDGNKQWIVACRVRAERGGWQYAWANLYASDRTPLPHNLTSPREVVVLPGGEARFSMVAQEQLNDCYFVLPGMGTSPNLAFEFPRGAASPNSTGRHLYLGAGPELGECGLALSNITKADNGLVNVYIRAPGYKDEVRFIPLIVAHPPPAPTISLVYTGTNLTATCRVENSRPFANISWILGDKVIHQDGNDDSKADPFDIWRWPWMEGSFNNTLTLQLKPEDQGQVLKCVVSHVALVQPLEASRVISIQGTTTSATPLTTPSITTSTAPETHCLATNYLDLLCLQLSQHGNTSCPTDEVREYRVREAKAAARAAEVEEEVARIKLEAAKAESELALEAARVALEAAKSIAKAEEARSQAEVARAQNAEEELQSKRLRRAKNQQTAESSE